jgi:hypothetical protein
MNYLDSFSSSLREMPRFMALAEAVLTQASDLISLVRSLPAAFSLSEAAGTQLDQLGHSLGVPRPLSMPDADYRALIHKKLRLWRWNGTNEEVPAVLSAIDPEGAQRDNDNLSVTITPSGDLPVDAKELYPIPAGVTIS